MSPNILFLLLATIITHYNSYEEPFSNTTSTYHMFNSQMSHEPINFISIFLLSSLRMASELGEEFTEGQHGVTDFFRRVRSSQRTWAHGVKHFYSVVGNGPDEIRVLSNTIYCHNITSHYRARHPTSKEEIYRCNGIKILYLPYCDPTSWGPMGPCCRCEGAMKYYLNQAAADMDYPKWFLFSDDDYHTRLHKMHGILSQVDPLRPYSVTAIPGKVKAGQKETMRMTRYAWTPFYDWECTVPCTHRSNWLGYAVFSLGAVRVMEPEVRAEGLIQTCRLWQLTHDVGLGLFVWEHAVPSLPVCCGASHPNEGNLRDGVYFHAIGKTKNGHGGYWSHDYILHRTWEDGAKLRGESSPNLTAYIEYEFNEGIKSFVPPFPSAGFENSLYYRKVQLSEVFAKQIPEHQMKKVKDFPLRRSAYSKGDCNVEMAFHIDWRNKSTKFPLKQTTDEGKKRNATRVDGSTHEPLMCAEYLEAVANAPIHLSDLPPLPPLEDLERK